MMYYYAALNEVVSKEKCTEDAFEPLMAEFGILKLMSDPKKKSKSHHRRQPNFSYVVLQKKISKLEQG